MIWLAAVIVSVLCGCSSPWTRADSMRQAGFFVLQFADYRQTSTIATEKHAGTDAFRYEEKNPILGKHPSSGEVNRYFLAATAAHTGIAIALPSPYRAWWQWAGIAFQSAFVLHNAQMGIRW